jgi:pimeloyl-ACP methyl ester carboxylesterase
MPYAHNQDVKIYYEIEGQGPALMFAHGATGNMNSWRSYGYVDKFKSDHTVILYDMRGHGQSDKPHTVEAYNYSFLIDDVIAVLDALQLDKTHFWGYSMGATIGFGLAKHYPQRIRSLILGGSSPYSEAQPLTEPPSPLLQIMRKGIEQGPDAVVQGIRDLFGEITPHYEARLRGLDYQAQAALLEYLDYHMPGLEDVLPTMSMPCLVYIADGDDPNFTQTQEYMKQMPNATFLGLPGHNHVSANTNLDVIVPNVRDFLAKVQ